MRCRPLVALLLLTLSATAHAGGKTKVVRAVIDRTVGGRVVSRKVVTSTMGRRAKQPVSLEQELSAARKGWSVTDQAAEMPGEVTEKGRLVEKGFRTQRNGRSILTLGRPGAQHLTGDQEIRIYSGGRLTRVKRLAPVKERGADGVRRGHGRRVAITFSGVEILSTNGGRSVWIPSQSMAFRYDPAEPFTIALDAAPGNTWAFSREALDQALEAGRGGEADVKLRASREHLEINLSSRNGGSARVRVPRRDAARFLAEIHRSVPRGHEMDGLDMDSELRGVLGD